MLLPHYHQILTQEQIPYYQVCKLHPITFSKHDSTDTLWKYHTEGINNLQPHDIEPSQSLLDLKIELAARIYTSCHFCEHACQVNRHTQLGYCSVQNTHIASEFLHIGEETPLIPSHTIFFSGCTLACVFCQNHDISQTQTGHPIEPHNLIPIIAHRSRQGSKNINWVGGDPTPHLFYILQVLKHLTLPLPQIWNSNMYCSGETMQLLNGIIDVYLTDFKFGNDMCAHRLSHSTNYIPTLQRNHLQAYNQGDLLIRHLVLPNHQHCCTEPIIDWIQQNTPDAAVNIMGQYHPTYHAPWYFDINHPLTNDAYQKACAYAKSKQLHLL